MHQDEIVNRTIISLSFTDRVRVLLGKKITLTVNIKTENVVGNTETKSSVCVDAIIPRKPQGGYGLVDV